MAMPVDSQPPCYTPPVPVNPHQSAGGSTMAASSTVPAYSSQGRFKHGLFFALGLMFLFVLWRDERFIIDHSHPAWAYFFPVRWWLLPHGLGGLTALLIGPFQFSSRLRQRHLRIHRIMGRFYLGAIAVSAPMGMYLTSIHNSLTIRFYVLPLLPRGC